MMNLVAQIDAFDLSVFIGSALGAFAGVYVYHWIRRWRAR